LIALFFYIGISFYYGRKNPMFYLILTYAMQQGPAAFIDQSITVAGKSIFLVVDQIFVDVLFFTTTIIAIFLLRVKLPGVKYTGAKLISLYFFYIIFLFIASLFSYSDMSEVVLSGRQLFYVSLSFYLWLSIFNSVTREQYEEFLRLLFYVTPFSALLYILNSSGKVSIFNTEMLYQEIEGTEGSFYRDFATIPIQLVPVCVITLMSFITKTIKVPRGLLLANLVILPVAVLFTFTRSILAGIAIQIVVLFILYSFVKHSRVLRQLLAFCCILILFLVPTYFIAQRFYPDAVDYFTERLTDAAVEKQNDQNVDIRLAYLNKAIDITNETSSVIGAGLNRKFYYQLDAIGAWNVDSTIPYLLYHTGWLGVAILYLILVFFIIDSFLYFIRTGDWLVAFICSGIITNTLSSLLMGGGVFTGSVWTFMNLALYTTIRLHIWKFPPEKIFDTKIQFA
jgi:hypothetical protein